MAPWQGQLIKVDDYRWKIPENYKTGMRVPGLIYASKEMLESMCEEQTPEQVANVAFLPGIVGYSLAMPDIHWGYGFPIGGVAAMDVKNGVISPGGVGYDINCGVRLLRTNLSEDEVRPRIGQLINGLFLDVPSGLGSEGKIRLGQKEMNELMVEGARWAVKRGLGSEEDLDVTEESGCIGGADPGKISDKAAKRGMPQAGTLGSGNHFLEIQIVKEIFDSDTASVMGITEIGQILVLIHTGSRGFGHQVCTDHLRVMEQAVSKYGINLPDRQLACAPIESSEGQDYLAAMACAANYAWANRQCIAHWIREGFSRVFGRSPEKLGMKQVYDVAHNIAKIEEHVIDGRKLKVCVHRKGATRAFPAGHKDTPDCYKKIGQPVLVPGDMGRCSFIAVGTQKAMDETFGSTCHGAGRMLSRTAAKRSIKGADVVLELGRRGITVKAENIPSLAEEASQAYKDVTEIIDVVHKAGISRKVAMAVPMGVIKG
ncbi:MAG: RNA-splicing ligase RtcB [Chloroflexi bacterium]|jgi:tRNA-splicing ligase RtcB|nr:MAG: RNA-splicing ligase RtcB [Chloroflexota bacterium]